MTDFDAIVIGAGHNGLSCASYLAQDGRSVLVLEASDTPGGAACTREFAPGYSVSACAQWLYQLDPRVEQDLSLAQHGLDYAARDLATVGLDEAGRHIAIDGAAISGERLPLGDIEAYAEFAQRMRGFAGFLAPFLGRRPPRLVDADWQDRLALLRTGLDMKLLGREEMRELMRVALINSYDLLQEHFSDPLLQGVLSVDSVLGTRLGPRSPNTVFTWLYRLVGEIHGFSGPAQVRGGMGALGQAFAAAARSQGAQLRTGAPVQKILLQQGRVTGVALRDGECLSAPLVVSGADPKTTFGELVGYPQLETGVVRRVHNLRQRGATAKLHLALDGLPEISGLSESRLGQRLIVAPDMDYVERAFNHCKYAEASTAPVMDISIPSLADPQLAPAGGHVLSALLQYVPLEAEFDREAYSELCLDTLERYAPGLRQQVVACELLTPGDLQQRHGMRGGQWHHLEPSLDQMLMLRPFPGASQYRTPVPGLYLCGAGSHPGGGIMGTVGRNAAREIIRGRGEP